MSSGEEWTDVRLDVLQDDLREEIMGTRMLQSCLSVITDFRQQRDELRQCREQLRAIKSEINAYIRDGRASPRFATRMLTILSPEPAAAKGGVDA